MCGLRFLIFLTVQRLSVARECPQLCADVCPNRCNSAQERGECDLTQGVCICYDSWGGNDCGTDGGPDPVPERGGNDPLDASEIPVIVESFEESVKTLSAKAEDLFSSAKSTKNPGWIDGCATPPGAECDETFGSSDDCDCEGRMVDYQKTSIRIPDELACRLDAAGRVHKVLSDLVGTYQDNFEENNDLSLQYFGSENGVFHVYPSYNAGGAGCSSYDPRRRPWYIAASSGAKRVILMVDRSGSMSSDNRMELAKDATKSVIEGLTFNDFVAVVAFSGGLGTHQESDGCDDGKMLVNQGGLIRATTENKKVLIEWVGSAIQYGGGNCFKDAFLTSFDLLDDCSGACQDPCRTALIFLTDGDYNADGDGDPTDKVVNYRKQNPKTDVFMFTLGDGADTSLPKSLAADVHGLFSHIPDGGDLISAMSSYYQYYAIGIAGNGNKDLVRWTEPYDSFSGLGPMMTAAQPVMVLDLTLKLHTDL